MSFFSNACQTCKSRHLKCDEGRPVCQRCVKGRRQCHRSEAIIHNENIFASRQKKRPPGPRAGPPSALALPPLTVSSTPSVDFKVVAFTYYLHKHLRAIDELPKFMTSQSDDVMQLWTPKVVNPLLELSISTMALAVFSRIHKHSEAGVAASSQYQKLLRSTRINMTSITTSNIDTALLAIFFMGRYEDSMHLPDTLEKNSFASALRSVPHHDGAIAMLKIWKDLLSAKQPPSSVITHCRQGLIRSIIMRTRPVPDWMSDGALFGESGLGLEYDRIMVRLANLRYAFSFFQNKKIPENLDDEVRIAMAHKLADEAQAIDDAVQTWAKHFPDTWHPQRHVIDESQSAYIGGTFVNTYANPAFSALWNRFHAARMLVNSTHIDIMRNLLLNITSEADADCMRCLSKIEAAADNLSANIAFILQRFIITSELSGTESSAVVKIKHGADPEPYVASMAAWPLTIASSLKYLQAERRQWFRTELGIIGGLLGNRVFEAVTDERWLEL